MILRMPRVTRKQPNSGMCLVCGVKNGCGLHASFYEVDGGELVALFTPREQHQSYPGRLHGGLITAMLDETIGRAVIIGGGEEVWGVTLEFTTKFKKPVPLDVELTVVGRIVRHEGRVFEGTGEILLPGGEVAATGTGKYLKLPIGRIADADAFAADWRVDPRPTDPAEIPLPPPTCGTMSQPPTRASLTDTAPRRRPGRPRSPG